ncbi:hypothetical protein SDRG_04887 [Saprolegnia diclina VS20]|uniref:Uncharacterized protein n=1 Tax=Saprolegnia diclina (strain VS20) TaxID=1156394 RepID=T0QT30_SAPDV|nr:hypothetical protein SDRG_04887 [Saprolegnia diclina VS20]EQC37866.1 hypothetical protein SDRG_04887 [Saprolegnia diclina VS20]|eukprot:XP_008608799.1 hypothetical protein SDRG_04887 [Saprolegnia diclina VS20]
MTVTKRTAAVATAGLMAFALAFMVFSFEVHLVARSSSLPLPVVALAAEPAIVPDMLVAAAEPDVLMAAPQRQLSPETYSLSQALDEHTHVHLVFTTSCNQGKRHFLSSSLQVSLSRVGHRGPLTEIVHGCSADEMVRLSALPTFYYDFRYHFAPDFALQGKDHYVAYNKPFGLRHFLQHGARQDNLSIALIDADYVLFKPLRINLGASWGPYYQNTTLRNASDITDTVADGVALAQNMKAFLGGRWFNDHNATMKQLVCGSGPCANVSSADAFEFYEPAGTPYIMTRSDWHRFVDDYAAFTVKGRQYQDDWMVEMYAYGAAAANQGIKHTLLKHLGPATCSFHNTEHWDFLPPSTPNPCADPFDMVLPEDPPIGIHYAMYYGAGDDIHSGYWYTKHRLPTDLTECDSMLLEVPPATEWTKLATLGLSERDLQTKRHNVWLQCTMTKYANQVLTEIKAKMCPLGFNTHMGISLDAAKMKNSAYPQKTTP